jgi:hypothetical protein
MKYTITLLTVAFVCLAGCSSTGTHASPKAWNAISEGMLRQQIVNSIGQPASQSSSSEVWRSEGWELRVAYDESGQATNVVRLLILK